MSANVDRRRGWACSVNGRPDFRQAQCRGSAVVLWRRWSFLIASLQDSVNTAASRHRGSGVMPARISSWVIGIARRQPETVQNVVEGGVKLFMWAQFLLQHVWLSHPEDSFGALLVFLLADCPRRG